MSEHGFLRVAEVLRNTATLLMPAAGEEAALEARILVACVLKAPVRELFLWRDKVFDEAAQRQLAGLIRRRLSCEPIQYIVGEWEFMGLPFRVRPGALIPRQDTETLVEAALKLKQERGYKTVLDLCCGTGCVGISLSRLGGMEATLTDISSFCIELAKENAALNAASVRVVKSDYFEHVEGQFDMIVSNPPYLNKRDMEMLQKEVQKEPRLALDGGEDGLFAYRTIAREYEKHLRPGGALLMEVGVFQAEEVSALFAGETRTIDDYNGIARVVVAEKIECGESPMI
ncbi:peptide chain release factor N(5)-glutamine methyltransferase [Christensenellaceae bacterium OttesenSCG-928-M15]|nr:peptide chain release factor N(5)-glutamine methyltransferase [Christensenellaceae bacterium OttesenSCG-928-M15]